MNKRQPATIVVLSFLICLAARFFEYFVLKTDGSVLAENVFHKLFGIAVLAALMFLYGYHCKDIEADYKYFGRYILSGIGLGVSVYAVAYAVEFVIGLAGGGHPTLQFYTESFSLTGKSVITASFGLILLCILMNVINVVMEEGLFRGFYDKMLSGWSAFWKRTLFIAFLFGIWHITMTIRSFAYGDMNLSQTIVMTIGYIILAGIMSIKWSLLKASFGTIWIGLGEHFFNNSIINLLHIVSGGEADQMQIVRVILANMISCIIVVIVYNVRKKSCGAMVRRDGSRVPFMF